MPRPPPPTSLRTLGPQGLQCAGAGLLGWSRSRRAGWGNPTGGAAANRSPRLIFGASACPVSMFKSETLERHLLPSIQSASPRGTGVPISLMEITCSPPPSSICLACCRSSRLSAGTSVMNEIQDLPSGWKVCRKERIPLLFALT